jgi:predicted RNA methylase
MESKGMFSRSAGDRFSAALDPHRRQSMERALTVALDECTADEPSVALVGWQAATLIEVAYERAARVVIIEDDSELIDSIEKGLLARNLGKKVKLVTEAPGEVSLDKHVDIAVASVTSTWFIEGGEAEVLANLRRNVLKKNGALVPRRLAHLFEIAALPTSVGGMPLRVPRYSRPGEPVPVLSESKHFVTTDLTRGGEIPEAIDDTIIVKPLLSGRISALRLTTLCELTEGVVQVTSQNGLQSILVPLREDVEVEAGQPVRIHIRYRLGEGLSTVRFSAKALPQTEQDEWEHSEHPATERFRERVAGLVDQLDQRGRGGDLDKVVSYTMQPHGDVSRLTAIFWTIDEDYKKPVRELIDGFRREASAEIGTTPPDEVIYDVMYGVYRQKREEKGEEG